MGNTQVYFMRTGLKKLVSKTNKRTLRWISACKELLSMPQVIKIKTRSSPLEAVFIRTKHYATHKQHPYCQYHLLTKKDYAGLLRNKSSVNCSQPPQQKSYWKPRQRCAYYYQQQSLGHSFLQLIHHKTGSTLQLSLD